MPKKSKDHVKNKDDDAFSEDELEADAADEDNDAAPPPPLPDDEDAEAAKALKTQELKNRFEAAQPEMESDRKLYEEAQKKQARLNLVDAKTDTLLEKTKSTLELADATVDVYETYLKSQESWKKRAQAHLELLVHTGEDPTTVAQLKEQLADSLRQIAPQKQYLRDAQEQAVQLLAEFQVAEFQVAASAAPLPDDEDDGAAPPPDDDDDDAEPPPDDEDDDPAPPVAAVGAPYKYPEILNSTALTADLETTFDDYHEDPFSYTAAKQKAADARIEKMCSTDPMSLFQLARAHQDPVDVAAYENADHEDIEREILVAASCFGPEIEKKIQEELENVKEAGELETFSMAFFKSLQSSIDAIKDKEILKDYETFNGLGARLAAARSSSASLSASGPPYSTTAPLPLRLSSATMSAVPTTLSAVPTTSPTPNTVAHTTGNVVVTNQTWEAIKGAIKAANPAPEVVKISADDKTISLEKAEIDIQREEHGVKVSTTAAPPDPEALVKNYKIAASALKQTTCLIESSPNAENTATLILALMKEPNSMKPVITNQKILDDLKDSPRPECMEAYHKLDIEKPKMKL
jgi:hypothetical protein